MHTFLALLRDGFHAQEPCGEVELRGDDSAVLYYAPSTIHHPLSTNRLRAAGPASRAAVDDGNTGRRQC